MLARLAIPAVFLVLTACAAAVPGYSPPPFKEQSKLAKSLANRRSEVLELECPRRGARVHVQRAVPRDTRDPPASASDDDLRPRRGLGRA